MIEVLRSMVNQMLEQDLNAEEYTEDSWLDYAHYMDVAQEILSDYDDETKENANIKEITSVISGLSTAMSELRLLSEEKTNTDIVIANVLSKTSSLPFEFEITRSDILSCIDDTTKEMGILPDDLNGDKTQLIFELRTVWWLLFRFRNSSLTNYKYDTGTIGRSVDKTAIAKQIKSMMDDIQGEFDDWKSDNETKKGSTYNGILKWQARKSATLL